ncbi:hypothetical protein ACH47B_13260 [Rhodococcus sp. NPDC019627]|uniref:hypothetical protein n=1 Tax=unclassified Rhodococcus (in: high G+C Gram-positive bacteria) TaxID=192944 RepID=UPI003403FB48
MSERLDAAYEAFDAALKELVAANEEDQGTEEAWVVSHYATVVGQQRFGDFGVESAQTLLLPFGGVVTYSLEGLLGKVPELIASLNEVEAECD